MSSDKPDVSPFTNLNKDVKLAILQQLEFREYRNVALTCRKWHDIASTAPRFRKPILRVHKLVMNPYNFYREKRYTIIRGIRHPFRREDKFRLSVHNRFSMVRQIKCRQLKIEHGIIRNEYDSAVAYLLENRDKFCIDKLHWVCHPDGSFNKDLLRRIFNVAGSGALTISVAGDNVVVANDLELELVKQECIRELIEEGKEFVNVDCRIVLPIGLFQTVLKQVVKGERPRMRYFVCNYADHDYLDYDELMERFVQREFSEIFKSKKRSSEGCTYRLMTPDSREVTIKHDDLEQKVGIRVRR